MVPQGFKFRFKSDLSSRSFQDLGFFRFFWIGFGQRCELGRLGSRLVGLGLGLSGTCAGLLELRVAQQVVELRAELEVDAHGGDVGSGEVLHLRLALAADGGGEGADVAQLDLVALEDELAHAAAQVVEDADDGALAEHGVVLGHVVGQFVDCHDARQLQLAVGLGGSLHGILHQRYAVLNFFHKNGRPPPNLPEGRDSCVQGRRV